MRPNQRVVRKQHLRCFNKKMLLLVEQEKLAGNESLEKKQIFVISLSLANKARVHPLIQQVSKNVYFHGVNMLHRVTRYVALDSCSTKLRIIFFSMLM